MTSISNHPQRIYDYFDKYIFLCEMYDEEADMIRSLVLQFFPFDNSVQVIDTQREKTLLRRVQLPSITIQMLQIGNIINVFSKLLYITDCAPSTRSTLFHNVQSTYAMIKPTPPSLHGKIITFIMKNGFRIVRMKNAKISKEFAMSLYSHVSQNLPLIIDYVTSGEVIGLELVAPDAVLKWRKCLGATDPKEAEGQTLRGLYGENILKNVAHGCNTVEGAEKNLEAFFGYANGTPRIPFRATFKDCTCCIIKPHVLIDGNVGQIFEQISSDDRFYISAMAMFSVKLTDAEEFYEVYKGVVPEYEVGKIVKRSSCSWYRPSDDKGLMVRGLNQFLHMCIHLAEGKCIVLEVKCKDSRLNCVCEFRKLCGPRDPDMCRQLYPDCIRALYGKTIVHNAVHCTDLPEDGELEVEYFFKLVAYTSE